MSFITHLGRHNHASFANDLGSKKAEKFGKIAGKLGNLSSEHHDKISGFTENINRVFTGSGIRLTSENVVTSLLEAGINKFINDSSSHSVMSQLSSTLSSNSTKYIRTYAHIGKVTTKRIQNMKSQPLVQVNKKELSSSNKDYIEHSKHRQLTLTSGFNEKGTAFLMEDLNINISDLLSFYSLNPSIEQNLSKRNAGIHHTYGAVFNLSNKIKITNEMKYYSSKVKIHLVKITDLHLDTRQLIQSTTNNKFNLKVDPDKPNESDNVDSSTLNDESTKDDESVTEAIKEGLLRKGKDALRETAEDAINKSNMPKAVKKTINKLLSSSYRSRGTGSDSGKIPEELQYSDPILTDLSNRFASSFLTSLNCKLTDSVNFNDRAKIVHTWNRSLSPGSIWDFNLTQHLGKGFNLNYLYDVKDINDKHPIGYIFVIEYFGDNRSKLIRRKDDDCFTGYSPVKIRFDFDLQLSYLGTETDNGDDKPVVYKTKRKDPDFEKNSLLDNYFTPDRQEYFHIPFNQIDLLLGSGSGKKVKKPYFLDYDTNILPPSSNSLLDQLQLDFTKHGLDSSNVNEDDSKYNLNNPPSSGDPTPSPAEDPDKKEF